MESKKKDSYVPTENDVISKPLNITNPFNEKITRRQAISRLGYAGIGVAAVVVVGVGGYLAYKEVYAPSSGPSGVHMGAVLSLSGSMAGFGQGQTFGHLAAIADINAQGGIDVNGKKLPITYTVYDDTSDPTKAASLAAQLILTDKVDILVHGNGPPVTTIPICTTAERYSCPFIMGSPFEPWNAAGPYKWCWSILFRIGMPAPGFPKGYTIADNYTGLANQYESQLNNKNVAVLAANDSDGTGWYAAFPGILTGAGYSVPDPQLYPALTTTDFSSIITKWKSDDCSVIWGNLPPPDYGTFWRQSAELGFRPQMATIGRAPLFYTDINSWGDSLALGVNTECWWDPSWGFKGVGSTTSETLANRWETQSSTYTPLNRNIAFGYAAVQIAADSMNRAGTLDKTDVNTAIGNTNGSFMNGPTKFFSDTHDSPCPITIAQWQPPPSGDTREAWVENIVFSVIPEYPTTGTEIFPLPPWPSS